MISKTWLVDSESGIELVYLELLGVGGDVVLLLVVELLGVDVRVGGHVLVLGQQLVDLPLLLAVVQRLFGVDRVVQVVPQGRQLVKGQR